MKSGRGGSSFVEFNNYAIALAWPAERQNPFYCFTHPWVEAFTYNEQDVPFPRLQERLPKRDKLGTALENVIHPSASGSDHVG